MANLSKIALVTCAQLPEPDVDETVLLGACLAAGLEVEYVGWDDPTVVWSRYHAAVLRSTWNYYEDAEAFHSWVDRVAGVCVLWNPAELVLANMHKSYLLGFEKLGIPIVPTRFIDRAAPQGLEASIAETGWDEFVIKPAVSAASFMTRRFTSGETGEGQAFLEEILMSRDAMVQKFLPRVSDGGEVNLVFIDGKLTHGIIKHPRFHDGVESVSEEAIQPTSIQRALAERIAGTVPAPWLYGRVDLMEEEDGRWVLSELELIEPSLFFLQSPAALRRFVDALKRVAG